MGPVGRTRTRHRPRCAHSGRCRGVRRAVGVHRPARDLRGHLLRDAGPAWRHSVRRRSTPWRWISSRWPRSAVGDDRVPRQARAGRGRRRRNVWRTDLDAALGTLGVDRCHRQDRGEHLVLRLHVPYPGAGDRADGSAVVGLRRREISRGPCALGGLREGRDPSPTSSTGARALAARARTHGGTWPARPSTLPSAGATRSPADRRAVRQQDDRTAGPADHHHRLVPPDPDIRRARAAHRNGTMDEAACRGDARRDPPGGGAAGELGLDVLVHGEPERNDMVQYFAELLDGFVTTATAGSSRTAAGACGPRSCSATCGAPPR